MSIEKNVTIINLLIKIGENFINNTDNHILQTGCPNTPDMNRRARNSNMDDIKDLNVLEDNLNCTSQAFSEGYEVIIKRELSLI